MAKHLVTRSELWGRISQYRGIIRHIDQMVELVGKDKIPATILIKRCEFEIKMNDLRAARFAMIERTR